MKIKKSVAAFDLLSNIVQICVTCCVIFLYAYSPYNPYQIQWLALLPLCLAFLHTHFSHDNKAFLSITVFQFLLILSFYGISHAFGPSIFIKAMKNMTWHLGFFPWSLMLTIAIGLRLTQLRTQKDVFIVDLITRITKTKREVPLAILHLAIRKTTNFILALTLALMSINIYIDFSGPLHTFSLCSLLSSVIIVILIFSKVGRYLIRKTVQSAQWLYISMPLYTVLITLLLSTFSHLLSTLAPTLQSPIPLALQYLNHFIPPTDIGLLVSYGWWLAWAGVGGIFIAHQARKLTLSSMILYSSIVPLCVGLAVLLPGSKIIVFTQSWIAMLCSMIGIIGLLKLLTHKNMLPCLMLGYLSHSPQPKPRAHQFIFAKDLTLVLVMLFLTIPIGLNMLSFLSCFISLPLELAALLMILVVLIQLIRVWRHDAE